MHPTKLINLGGGAFGSTHDGVCSATPVAGVGCVYTDVNRGPFRVIVGAEAESFALRSAAIGGLVPAATLLAIDTFVSTLKSASLWSKIIRLNLFCGSNIYSALTPLINTGGDAYDTNVNFVSANYAESTSFTKGSGKYIKTGYVPANAIGGLFVFSLNAQGASGSRGLIGCRDSGQADCYRVYGVTPSVYGNWGLSAQASGTSETNGAFHSVRSSATVLKLYKNGSQIAISTSSVTPTGIAPDVWVYGLNAAGVLSADPTADTRIGGYSIDDGTFTDEIAVTYYTAWVTMMAAIGRVIS